jgi:hypothetical protein
VRARNIRGTALDEIGAFELALADYDDAIRIDPNNPAVLHDRAILWRRKGALIRHFSTWIGPSGSASIMPTSTATVA